MRIRSSTVEGLSNNASFCVETRLKNDRSSTALPRDDSVCITLRLVSVLCYGL